MPFGLINAPATFQRAIDSILSEEINKSVVAYLDDIVVFSKSEEEHNAHLHIIFKKLQDAGIKLNQKKCVLKQRKIHILGHVIENGFIKTDESKVKSISEFRTPRNVKELHCFFWAGRVYKEVYTTIIRNKCSIIYDDEKCLE